MPQGEKLKKSDLVVPKTEAYARKPKNVRRGGPMGIMVNDNFAAALPSMTRNIEQIIAGKAVQDGAFLLLNDVKEKGATDVKEHASLKRKRNEVSVLLSRGRNAKGVRGEYDLDELAELEPELKKLVTERMKTSGGGSGGGSGGKKGSSSAEDDSASAAISNFVNDLGISRGKKRGGGGSGSASASGGGGGRPQKVPALDKATGKSSSKEGVFADDDAVAATFGDDFV
jgi:hypothetical protein